MAEKFIKKNGCNMSNINYLNEVFRDVELTPSEKKTLQYLCTEDIDTIRNIISAFKKLKEE